MNSEQAWQDIYARVAAEQVEGESAANVGTQVATPPPSFMEATRASWMGEHWLGRAVAEDWWDKRIYRQYYEAEYGDFEAGRTT